MRFSSLMDSPSPTKLNKQIYHSQITKQHLQGKNDKLLQYLDDLLEESDPREQYKKIVENRMRRQKELQEENKRLTKQNQSLKEQLERVSKNDKRMNQREQSPKKGEYMDDQSPCSSSSKPSSQQIVDIPPQYQAYLSQRIDQMHSGAQQIAHIESQSIRKSIQLLQLSYEKLEKLVQLQKMTAQMQKLDKDSRDTVVVSREKYNKLLEYYVTTIVPSSVKQHEELKDYGLTSKYQGTQQLTTETSQRNQLPSLQYLSAQILTNSSQLQQLFTQLAKTSNLHIQWLAYLAENKSQAETFKKQVDRIMSGTSQEKQTIQKKINNVNDSTISFRSNILDESTALSIINVNQNEIEDILFKKIQKLIKKLQFKPAEIQLFSRFNQKRKVGRLFNVQEFLYKFKEKQDLYEISKQYTSYLIRTVNVLVMKMMEVLADQNTDSLNPEKYQFPWLITKLNTKSTQLKDRLLQTLQKQFSLYLQQKHPPKSQDPLKQRKIVEPIREVVFDESKQLQRELVKVVMEYRDLMQSCVVNSNRRVTVKLW